MAQSVDLARIRPDTLKGARAHNAYLIFVIIFVSLGSAAYGFTAAIIGTTLGQPSFIVYMGLKTASNATQLIGAVVALFNAGGVFGAFCASWISNRHGRKWSIAVAAVMMLISSALMTASVNIAMFIVFRFFSGWACFQLLASVPLWVTEIAPPANRGTLTDISTVMVQLGFVVAGYTGLGFYFFDKPTSWRGPLGLSMIFPALLLSGLYWMPESPRYLITANRHHEAWNIIRRVHRSSDDSDHFAEIEFIQMKQQIESDKLKETSYISIFRKPALRRRAFLSMFLTFSQMSSGVLVINNYGSLIYGTLGFGPTDVLYFLTGWTSAALVFNLCAMTFVDRIARNKLISLGFFCCMLSLVVEAALQAEYLTSTNRGALGAAVAMTYIYVMVYSLFLDGPTYFYIGEIWPSHLRAQGFALSTSVLCLAQLIWGQAAPTAFANIGWKYYLFFIFFSALGSVVTLLTYPDTLGKPLEEIAAMFGENEVVVLQRDVDPTQGLGLEELQHTHSGEKGSTLALEDVL